MNWDKYTGKKTREEMRWDKKKWERTFLFYSGESTFFSFYNNYFVYLVPQNGNIQTPYMCLLSNQHSYITCTI